MGRVYKVFDTEIKEKVALKLLKPEIVSNRDTWGLFLNLSMQDSVAGLIDKPQGT
jgi:hypothetical protein